MRQFRVVGSRPKIGTPVSGGKSPSPKIVPRTSDFGQRFLSDKRGPTFASSFSSFGWAHIKWVPLAFLAVQERCDFRVASPSCEFEHSAEVRELWERPGVESSQDTATVRAVFRFFLSNWRFPSFPRQITLNGRMASRRSKRAVLIRSSLLFRHGGHRK